MAAELRQTHQRDLNCLADSDRSTRKRSLKKLHKTFTAAPPTADQTAFFVETLLPALVRLLDDPTEKCRELSIQLLAHFAPSAPGEVLHASLPAVAGRFAQNQTEPSEELRLQLLQLLRLLAQDQAPQLDLQLLVPTLCRAAGDAFADVKREVCAVLRAVVDAAPAGLGVHAAPLVRALLPNLGHQHSKTRQLTLGVMSRVVVLPDAAQGLWQLLREQVLPAWDRLLFDRNATVRRQLLAAAERLLVSLPAEPADERTQVDALLLPILLAGLSDDAPELRERAQARLEAVDAHPQALVRRLMPQVLPPLLERTDDWTVRSRARAAAVLLHVIELAGEAVAEHLPAVVAALARGCRDEDADVAARIGASTAALARAVPGDVLVPALLDMAGGRGGPGMDTAQHRVNGLVLLAAAAPGLPNPEAHLPAVAEALAAAELVESDNPALRLALLHAIESVLESAGSPETTLHFVTALTHLVAGGDAIAEAALDDIDGLAESLGLADRAELYRRDADAIVAQLVASVGAARWGKASPKRALFDALLRHGGAALAAHADAVMGLFRMHLEPECDADLRLAMLALLESALGTDGLDRALAPHARDIVTACVLPNCVWRAGRVAATIRKVALAALYTLLSRRLADQPAIFAVAGQVLPVLKSCIDDDDAKTRRLVCLALHFLFAALPNALSDEPVRELYPELLKRLDDSDDDVRRAVCRTFVAFLHATPAPIFQGTFLECSLDALLIHLDDPDEGMQAAVLDVLVACAAVDAAVVERKAREARARHRTPVYVDRLLSSLGSSSEGGSSSGSSGGGSVSGGASGSAEDLD